MFLLVSVVGATVTFRLNFKISFYFSNGGKKERNPPILFISTKTRKFTLHLVEITPSCSCESWKWAVAVCTCEPMMALQCYCVKRKTLTFTFFQMITPSFSTTA